MLPKRQAIWTLIVSGLFGLLFVRPAVAHPMGNFSISHYARITVEANRLTLRYLLDFAEIPTVSEIDKNGDSHISDAERAAYLSENAARFRDRLTLTADGKSLPLEITQQSLTERPGAGGLQTMLLTMDLTASLPESAARIAYKDDNFPERTGWKEIITEAGSGARIGQTSAATTDLSHALTTYPTDPATVPPQQTEAAFTVGTGNGGTDAMNRPANVAQPASRTPQDAFTQTIATKKLTAGVILFSLLLAFVFGAFHALSPGHGKAMVAAYLVGSKGTVKHAVFLGAVVTLTHTIGVFALGFITLLAARYIVPEKLYPVLSALSGVAIVVIGVSLLRQRIQAMLHAEAHAAGHAHTHDHAHSHDHHHHHDHTHEHDIQPHDHDEAHSHDHSHDHAHDAGWHDHGDGHYHSHAVPDDMPISLKTLLVLGVTGGALPCPSALVVMLSAIALHRVAFGLALITSFSLGLAAVLTGIGILVVSARGFLEKIPMGGRLSYRLPVFSAAVVTLIGLVLVVRAVNGGF